MPKLVPETDNFQINSQAILSVVLRKCNDEKTQLAHSREVRVLRVFDLIQLAILVFI